MEINTLSEISLEQEAPTSALGKLFMVDHRYAVGTLVFSCPPR